MNANTNNSRRQLKKGLYILITMFISISISAQHDLQFSQFMFNKLAYNPGYAGSKDALAFNLMYRNQWTSIEGAPETYGFHVHSPFMKDRGGIGLSITHDKIGIVTTSLLDLSYAYRINLEDKLNLAIGLKYRQEFGRVDWTKSDPLDVEDGLIPQGETTKSSPNFGVGLYVSHQKYYLGISMPNLLTSKIYEGNPISGIIPANKRTFYIMGGLVTRLSEKVYFKPSALISYNQHAPFEIDINASFLFMEALWIGATYRDGDSVDAVIQYQFNKQFKLGAAFDFTFSELSDYTPGSFEIMLEYILVYDKSRLYNLRFF